MEWKNPIALYLILPLGLAWLLLVIAADRRRRRARDAFVGSEMRPRILPELSPWRFWLKLVLAEVALILGLVALAGPRFGTHYEQVVPRGSDLYILVDVSRSMLADDVAPSRLGRAQADISALLNRLDGERVGLIAFAGQAVIKCPLTVDYDSFRRSLDELDPDSAPRGGTAIGDAIRKAMEVFATSAERDRAILLITDGDDQQSYPLEAADVAAEQKVTIFTVGLGDAEQGARIPGKKDTQTFIEYKGEQVWSKLNSSLLQEIALKTKGIYIPAGTRAYDLGELYVDHLQGRRNPESASQQKLRRTERFQLFLAPALAALLVNVCLGIHRRQDTRDPITVISAPRNGHVGEDGSSRISDGDVLAANQKRAKSIRRAVAPLILGTVTGIDGYAESKPTTEPHVAVRSGLRLYAQEKYAEAREEFSAARDVLEKEADMSESAAIVAFNAACAAHRAGKLNEARDDYLKAGLSQEIGIATAAHFNLGNLAAEQAHQLAGSEPDSVPAEKRQEILGQLQHAITAYRHCLELQPEHPAARRNLELVRQWIKYYSDRWHHLDREKRRQETNLLQFLEYILATQTGLRASTDALRDSPYSDAFAELKQVQDELRDEVPALREKISQELQPPSATGAAPNDPHAQQRAQGIHQLRNHATEAEKRMTVASQHLSARDAPNSVGEQQSALDELDQIWDAVIPFHPLLAKELADQTAIAASLAHDPSSTDHREPQGTEDPVSAANGANSTATAATPNQSTHVTVDPTSATPAAGRNWNQLARDQSRALEKTKLLAPKAEAELQQLEQMPPPTATPPQAGPQGEPDNDQEAQDTDPPIDPEQLKSGYRKAIELAPLALEHMEGALRALEQQEPTAAASESELARQVLKQIQDAQSHNQPQQTPDKQDDNKSQDQNRDQNQKESDEKKEQESGGDSTEQDRQQEKKTPSEKQNSPEKGEPGQDGTQAKPQQTDQISQDRLEEILRKVRERQQAKRERDRGLKGYSWERVPVEKDW